MELKGTIKQIKETQLVSDTFQKRELILTTKENPQYPQDIMIEFQQDKTEILNQLKVGQEVKVSINVKGREITNPQGEVKHFNTLKGWKYELINDTEIPNAPLPNEVGGLDF